MNNKAHHNLLCSQRWTPPNLSKGTKLT